MTISRTSLVLAAVLTAALAGCGGGPADSAGPPAESAAPSGGDDSAGTTLKVAVELTGATAVHGDTSTTLYTVASCDEYAKGAPDTSGKPVLALPTLISQPPVDGHQVLFTNQLTDYHGPGRYAKDSLTGQGGGATVEIDGAAYALGSESTADTEVRPDGSGEMSFTGFRNEQSGGRLGGKVSWTCTS